MVRKRTDDGKGWYHEPPYTEEEEDELYRRMDAGPFARIIRQPRPSVPPQPPQKPPLEQHHREWDD